jgi:hypothetical protein
MASWPYNTAAWQRLIERDFGEIVGKIIGRRIVCEFRTWVGEAVRQRDERAARKEIVKDERRLDDWDRGDRADDGGAEA